jgi:hypothetical protein
MFYVYGRNGILIKARIYQVESVELRAAFIVRVQIQTTDTIGFHIKSNSAMRI